MKVYVLFVRDGDNTDIQGVYKYCYIAEKEIDKLEIANPSYEYYIEKYELQ